MTRTETIARITSTLSSFDDERLSEVAEIVQNMEAPPPPLRKLSERERGLLEQSKADFAAGRTYSHEEIIAMLDDRLALRGVARSTGKPAK